MSGRRARRQRAGKLMTDAPQRVGAARVTPIGLVSQYLTIGDLQPRPPALWNVPAALMTVSKEAGVAWAAMMLAPSAFGDTWRPHQRSQVRQWFDVSTPTGRRARHLVESGQRVLLAPQVLLLMAHLACVYGTPGTLTPIDADSENRLREAMLVLAHHLGEERRQADAAAARDGRIDLDSDTISPFEVGLVANHHLNRTPYPVSVIDRFERRWQEIPQERAGTPQMLDLAAEYQAATGVPLNALTDVVHALWSRTVIGAGPVAPPGYLDGLRHEPRVVDSVLELITDTPAGIAQRSLRKANPRPGTHNVPLDPEYDTALFGQTPVLRLSDGSLLVVSPILLLERAFGWLPAYDIAQGLTAPGASGQKHMDRVNAGLRKSTEIFAVETLTAAAHASGQPVHIYDEYSIQAAYGIQKRNADAACAWSGHWVVAEVSARQTPQTVIGAASAQALLDHLTIGALEKAKQLHGTITAIRNDESRLTGTAAEQRQRRFWPLLIVPDGFPVMPMTVRRLNRMLRAQGFLDDSDTADMVIVDAETLEAVETVGLQEKVSLPQLLAAHATSDMAQESLKNWLIATRKGLRPPPRVHDRWSRNRFAGLVDDPGEEELTNTDPPT